MRIAVFGATGGTGQAVVHRALSAGHEVTAFARRPEALTARDDFRRDRLTVVQGDIFESAKVESAVARTDAVVSALGIGHSRAATQVYSIGVATIVKAMKASGVRRLSCVSTTGLGAGPGSSLLFRLVVSKILQRVLARPYADMARMEEEVRNSGLDWTIVRAARLVDQPANGRYRVSVNCHLAAAWSIPRADLADYLVAYLGDSASIGAVVEVAR